MITGGGIHVQGVQSASTALTGPFFSPSAGLNPAFIVMASAIVYPTNGYVLGQPITWGILDQSTAHSSSFYTSVNGDPGNSRLVVNFPTVKSVLNTTITVDESFAANVVIIGSTTGLSNLQAPIYRTAVAGIRLTGNGTANWVKSGQYSSLFDIGAFGTGVGGTLFNINTLNVDYNGIVVSYMGPNNYHIQRFYSGLGSFNAAFAMVTAAGTLVTTNPTSLDEVTIANAGTVSQFVQANVWTTTNGFMAGTFFNFWVMGMYECWLIASPTSTASILVRFQPIYPGATNYKVFRDTVPTFATQVLVYTGTAGGFTDAGLLPNTIYYYKLVGVIGGVDTDITTFRSNTNAF